MIAHRVPRWHLYCCPAGAVSLNTVAANPIWAQRCCWLVQRGFVACTVLGLPAGYHIRSSHCDKAKNEMLHQDIWRTFV